MLDKNYRYGAKEYIDELIEDLISAAADYGSTDEDDDLAMEKAESNLNHAADMLYKAIDNIKELL